VIFIIFKFKGSFELHLHLQFPRAPLEMLQGIWRIVCMCVMLDIREYVLSSSHIISESKLIGSYFVIILIWIPDF
jgi:hypothetical protein